MDANKILFLNILMDQRIYLINLNSLFYFIILLFFEEEDIEEKSKKFGPVLCRGTRNILENRYSTSDCKKR